MSAKTPLSRGEWIQLCEELKGVDPENLDNIDRDIIARVLGVIPDNKPFGSQLFDALTYLAGGSPAFEAGLARVKDGKIEVYLRQRSMSESAYPGEWHLPGSFFRKGEQPIDVANRLCSWEFEGVKIAKIHHLENFFVDEARGSVLSILYAIEIEGEPTGKSGKWFDHTELPKPLVDHHDNLLIPRLLEYMGSGR